MSEHTPSPQSVVVPVEPTEEMIHAGERAAWDDDNSMPAIRAMPKAWSAMLAAAPAPSSLAGGEDIGALDQELIDRGLRTVRAYDAVRFLRDALSATTARLTGYDWNADPEGLTKQQGDAFALADKVFADLTAAVDAHPDIELPECQTCGGTGKTEEAAQAQGANQHSACVRTCDDCDGCGFAPDEKPSAILAALSPEAPARDGVHWQRLGVALPEYGRPLLIAHKRDGEDFWRVRDAHLYRRYEGVFASLDHLKGGEFAKDWWFDSVYPGKGDLRLAHEDLLWSYMPEPDTAAPSADKLRIAVEALEKAKAEEDPAEVYMLACEALAALKAEGA